MGPALIGRPLDGIWHTGIVVFGKEYFFGGSGIEFCNPGGTQLGQPLQVEDLGETEINEALFQDYLRTQSQDRFRGDRYDLLRHNCNNFSHEAAQFLVGKGIPQHILDLPNEIMATPLGQMLAPMIQQMTPSGNSLPFNMGNGEGANGAVSNEAAAGGLSSLSNTQKEIQNASFPYKDFITFDQALKVDGLAKKLEEFNSNQKNEDTRLTDSELKVVLGIAKGLVRLSDENFSILTKIQKWEKSQVFPLLDILRSKCLKPSFDNSNQIKEVLNMFEKNLSSDSQVNSMLAARGISNILSNPKLQHVLTEFENLEKILCSATALFPTGHQNLEISLASLLYNVSVQQIQKPNLEASVLVASSIATEVLPSLTQDEAIYRTLLALGNITITGPAEVKELLQSMEIGNQVKEYMKKEEKIASCSKEILKMLGPASDGLDLD
eukprot:GFUD01007327.1.p1 GENE.GFUD01007327.1~~GFUD01007327.1.p1  ORF type:complete len:483 (+),score=120.10 GFUD01007327.1:136-1449(+)